MMTYLIVWYLSIAMLDVAVDGGFCYIAKKRFNLSSSIIFALIWPVTLPICIYGAWVRTRNFPAWNKD